MSATFAGAPGGAAGRSRFEWILGGRFLLEHSTGLDPAPDSTAIVGPNRESTAFVQHYFDSRGVVRIYAMTFVHGVWTLLRDKPDFSPLDFKQRFVGTFSADRRMIDARWEADAGSGWRLDFEMTYSKIA